MTNGRVGLRVGYVRVSTFEQNEARQLENVELDRTFIDKASGKDTKRLELEALLAFVREGDSVIVHSMDRLARNVDDLRRIVRQLTGKGIAVEFVKEGLRFTGDDSPMSNLLLTMLGAVAEFERCLIKERQREGIAIAKRRGVYKGRKPSLTPERIAELRERLSVGGVNKSHVAREFGISRETLYQCLKEC